MNFRALSLFSSAGIAETYFEKHGISVKVASELLPERVRIYKHLYPSVNMFTGDITNREIFSQVISSAKEEKCNFLIATPPCQGMSTAGKQLKDDPRNRLACVKYKCPNNLFNTVQIFRIENYFRVKLKRIIPQILYNLFGEYTHLDNSSS